MRILGALLTCLMLLLQQADTATRLSLRSEVFDAYQRQVPRTRSDDRVIVLAIDDLSLQRRGQWPWPRCELAELIDKLAAQRPAAIAIDMIFAEPDRLSPRAQAQRLESMGYAGGASAAAKLPDCDRIFAQSLRDAGVVLGVGGLSGDPRLKDPVDYRAPVIEIGGAAAPFLRPFPSVLRSLDSIDRAAAGHGVLNADAEDGVVRSVPALAAVGGHVIPGLAVEVMRQTSDDPVLRAHVSDHGLSQVEVAGRAVPTSGDGSWWIHFSDPELRPIFPVIAFLDGTLPAELITGRIVLIGAAASGLQDRVITPLGPMPGVSVHAEALDNVYDGRLLSRPYWSTWVEAGLLLLLCLFSIIAVPALRPLHSVLMFGAVLLLDAATGLGAFVWRGWLLDVGTPMVGAGIVFAMMMSVALGQAQQQRRTLRVALAVSREEQARMEGELDAARRIQKGMLPDPAEVLAGEKRVDLAALMHPARTVGGDLYDFFRLDGDRLFFLVGDVSGKGLPASLFMALSKALIKNAVLDADGDPGRGLSQAARVLALENPESMFVSVLAGVLNMATGELVWCSAGHEGPYLLSAGKSAVTQLVTPGGPPLCMLDGFDYPIERMKLKAGDALCLITDGITEAMDSRDQPYGSARLVGVLASTESGTASRKIVDRLRRDVEKFASGLEPADDLTILVIRWKP
jgi:adenylate cyclase